MPLPKSNLGFCFLNCIQQFIQTNALLSKMSRYHVPSLTQTLSLSCYKTVVVSISHLFFSTQKCHRQFRGKSLQY